MKTKTEIIEKPGVIVDLTHAEAVLLQEMSDDVALRTDDAILGCFAAELSFKLSEHLGDE